MNHLCTRFVVEAAHQRQWRFGRPGEQPGPTEIGTFPPGANMLEHGLQNCRRTVGDGDTFTDDGLCQRCGFLGEIASGQDDLVGHQRRSLREAPTLAMEHWCYEHGAVIEGHAYSRSEGHRVQVDRPVRIVDAFWGARWCPSCSRRCRP